MATDRQAVAGELDQAAMQVGFARLVGISEPALSVLISRRPDLLPPGGTYRAWLLRYCEWIREQAAGRQSADGYDIVKERCLTERVDRELKLLQLAERRHELVNIEELRPALENAFVTIKSRLLNMAGKMKSAIDARYGIDVDLAIIQEEAEHALSDLARHADGYAGERAADERLDAVA